MKYKKHRDLIVNGSLYKVILKISIPLMISELIQRAYTLTDMYFMGRMGSIQVAALTFVDPVINAVMAAGMGLSVPMLSMVSQNIGSKNYEGARRSIGNLIFLASTLSLIIGLLGTFASHYILSALNVTGPLLHEGSSYLRIVLLGTFFTFINVCYLSVKQAEGDTLKPLYMNIASLAFNLLLNPIFIFRMDMGITGAAVATVISKGFLAAYGIYDLFYTGRGLKISREHLKISRGDFLRILALGIPAVITKSTSPIGNMLINSHAVGYGASVIAAVGLGNKVNSILFSLSTSLCATMSTITGQNIGAGNISRVKEAVKKMGVITILIGIAGSAVIIGFSDSILSIFTADPAVKELTKEFFIATTPTAVAWGIYQIVMGVHQGAGYTKISMYITVIRLWLMRIPLVFVLDRFIGARSLWYSTAVATNAIGVVAVLFYLSGIWERKNKYITV